VDKISFYLKDTYDFLDENKFGYRIPEFLGVWSKKGILSKSERLLFMSSYSAGLIGDLVRNFSGYCSVFNHDFRRWQKNIGQAVTTLYFQMYSGLNLKIRIGSYFYEN